MSQYPPERVSLLDIWVRCCKGLFRCSINPGSVRVRIWGITIRNDSGTSRNGRLYAHICVYIASMYCVFYDASRSHDHLPTPAHTNVTRRSITILFRTPIRAPSDPSACDRTSGIETTQLVDLNLRLQCEKPPIVIRTERDLDITVELQHGRRSIE